MLHEMLGKLFSAISYPQANRGYATIAKPRLPPHFHCTNHRERCLAQFRSKDVGLERYIYLNGLKDREPNLFYELLLENMMVRFYACIHG